MAPDSLASVYRRESSDPSVVVADGQNITITVRNGQLRITDGMRSNRRVRDVARHPKTVSRIVILGPTGYITLESLRYCADESIAITQIGPDDRILFAAPGLQSCPLVQKAQILASTEGVTSPTALAIVKVQLSAKLSGQSEIARMLLSRPDLADRIDAYRTSLQSADNIDAAVSYEGNAAIAYWQAWENVTVPFSPHDLLSTPGRWHTFTGRTSHPGAVDPINAMLSFIYRVAETEAIHACHINGIDPTFGFSHVTQDDRNSMALDIMECIRPECDRIVLSLLDYGHGVPIDSNGRPRYFPANWCYEQQHGVTRLFSPLTHMLTEHAAELAESLAPVMAEIVAILRSHKPVTKIVSSAHVIPHRGFYAPPRPSGKPHRDTRMPVPSSASDVISDEAWKIISRHVPEPPNRPSRLWVDDRVIVAAIVWTAANNLPVKQLPATLHVGDRTVYHRRKSWVESGAWPHIAKAIRRTVLPGYHGD
jgi:CRISPR-associated endonuclease Cas1